MLGHHGTKHSCEFFVASGERRAAPSREIPAINRRRQPMGSLPSTPRPHQSVLTKSVPDNDVLPMPPDEGAQPKVPDGPLWGRSGGGNEVMQWPPLRCFFPGRSEGKPGFTLRRRLVSGIPASDTVRRAAVTDPETHGATSTEYWSKVWLRSLSRVASVPWLNMAAVAR